MKLNHLLGACALACAMATGTAQAAELEDFSGPATGWTVDRYAPSTFATSGGTLHEGTSVADGANNRPGAYSAAFYNTQGMAKVLEDGTTFMSIDLYLDPTWAGDTNRQAGFWGVGVDGSNAVNTYPIVEYYNGGFRGWDNGTGAWFDMGASSTPFGSWVTLGIALNTTTDMFTYTAGNLSAMTGAYGTKSLDSTILQVYNTTGGRNYEAQWDNLATKTGAVPEPSTWAMMILGFGLIGATLRGRRTVPIAA